MIFLDVEITFINENLQSNSKQYTLYSKTNFCVSLCDKMHLST